MQADPYAPPAASVDGLTPDEISAGGLRYSTFWRRFAALLIDGLLAAPIFALDYFIGNTQMYYLYTLLPGQLLGLFLYVYMVRKYGGGPGKLLMGLKIVMTDGSPVTLKAALLRYAVMWALGLLTVIAMIMAALALPAESFAGLNYATRSVALQGNMPNWAAPVQWASQLWYLACIVAFFISKQRRVLHDFIAGTVVVYK